MKTETVFLRLTNGDRQEEQAMVSDVVENGVHAVYINGASGQTLDADFGAGIVLKVDKVKSWMADYRHSEYWCSPFFGTALSELPEETQGLKFETLKFTHHP